MKKFWYWIIGIAVVLLIIGLIAFGLGALRFSQMSAFPMWDRTRSVPGGFGYWPERGGMHMTTPWHSPFMGLLGGLLMFLLPVGILALIVVGVVMLVRAGQKSSDLQADSTAMRCPNCGKEVQADWKVCPHCGEGLKED